MYDYVFFCIVIFGVGMVGFICVYWLYQQGLLLVIFEKSCGVGGWFVMCCIDSGDVYDYGVQFVMVCDLVFVDLLENLQEVGVVVVWLLCLLVDVVQFMYMWWIGMFGMSVLVWLLVDVLDICLCFIVSVLC